MDKRCTHNRKICVAGEEYACEYYIENGYTLLDRNFRINLVGEIDIIAIKDNNIVFVEVKTRTNDNFGSPVDAVNLYKQRKIQKTARLFLHKEKIYYDMNCRFDVASVYVDSFANIVSFDVIENAF